MGWRWHRSRSQPLRTKAKETTASSSPHRPTKRAKGALMIWIHQWWAVHLTFWKILLRSWTKNCLTKWNFVHFLPTSLKSEQIFPWNTETSSACCVWNTYESWWKVFWLGCSKLSAFQQLAKSSGKCTSPHAFSKMFSNICMQYLFHAIDIWFLVN